MYRFLRLTPEKVFSTFDATSTLGRYIRMDQPNNFKPMQKTTWVDVTDPLTNAPLNRFPTTVQVGGKLTACVYVEDAIVLLGLAGQKCDAIPSTVPWVVTTPLIGDLASVTLDFGYSLQDGTLKRKRYLGVKAKTARIYVATGDDPRLMVDLDLVGTVCQGNGFDSSVDPDATAFPEPAADGSAYGVLPYMIFDAALSVGGAARLNAKSFEVNIESKLSINFDTKRFAQRITSRGRTVKWSASWLADGVLSTDRTAFDSQASLGAGTATFTHAGASVAFDFKAQSRINSIDEDMPLDENAYFSEENQAFLDGGVDMALTIDVTV